MILWWSLINRTWHLMQFQMIRLQKTSHQWGVSLCLMGIFWYNCWWHHCTLNQPKWGHWTAFCWSPSQEQSFQHTRTAHISCTESGPCLKKSHGISPFPTKLLKEHCRPIKRQKNQQAHWRLGAFLCESGHTHTRPEESLNQQDHNPHCWGGVVLCKWNSAERGWVFFCLWLW